MSAFSPITLSSSPVPLRPLCPPSAPSQGRALAPIGVFSRCVACVDFQYAAPTLSRTPLRTQSGAGKLGPAPLPASQRTRVVSAPLPHAAPLPLLWSPSHGRPPSSVSWPAPLTQVLSISGPLGGATDPEAPGGQTRPRSRSRRVATVVPASQRRKLRLGDTKLRPTVAQLTTVRQGFDPCALPSGFSAA